MKKSVEVTSVVTEHVSLEFGAAQGEAAALEAELIYAPTDPFAVTMVFKTGSTAVRWTFGRDLLINGLYEPTGDGDVHVWPCLSADGCAVVILELSSPDGEVLVQAQSRDIARFVNSMLSSVPEGTESTYLDLDAALAGIFS